MPYRASAKSEPELPARELAYVSADRDRGAGAQRRALQVLILAAILIGILRLLDAPTLGWCILGAALVWGALHYWLAPGTSGVVLRVERECLLVRAKRSNKVLYEIRLSSLDDVLLDSKTVAKVVTRSAMMPVLRHADTKVAPEFDVARIALIPLGEAPAFFLTEEYASHQETVEWFAKIRRFLRSHGWLPVDERRRADQSPATE